MDLISVIVPIYNVEPYLLRCVESIQRQTYKNLEIILVDDGSPDRCPQMCDEIKKSDSRVKVIHKENRGASFARNSGLDTATGNYVVFIDSDDWISDAHIENLYRAAKENSADCAVGGHTTWWGDGEERVVSGGLEKKVYEGSGIIENMLLPLISGDVDSSNDVPFDPSSCMNLYRMDVVRENNIRFISERYVVSEDQYFNLEFFHFASRVVVTNEVGYYYFVNQSSISRKYNPKWFETTINSYYELKEKMVQYGLSEKAAYRVERSYLTKIKVAIRHIVFSDLKRSKKIREIRKILNHELTEKVLSEYPIQTYPSGMRLFSKMMRSKNILGVYYLTLLRESSRNKQSMKRILTRFGIRA